jgi:hypothetical protein
MTMRSCLLLLVASCRASFGPSYSAGSVGVSGNDTGVGGSIDVEVRHRSGLAGAITADLGGYVTADHGERILWSELQGRYRLPLYDDARYHVFATGGLGVGYTWCCYKDDRVLSAFFEIAADRSFGRFRIGAALRERPAYFSNYHDSRANLHNTLSLALTLGID